MDGAACGTRDTAAKTGSLIVPIPVRRLPDDTFHGAWSSPIEVPSSDPADLQRATQAIADALASSRRGGARPVVQLQADMAVDCRGGGRSRTPGRPHAGRRRGPGPGTGVQLTVRRLGPRLRGRAIRSASWLACHLPEAPLVGLAELAGDLWHRATPERAAQARRNLARVVAWLDAESRGTPRSPGAPPMTPVPSSVSSGLPTGTRHAITSRSRGLRPPGAELPKRLVVETPETVEDAFRPGRPAIFVGLHFGAIELPALFLASRVGEAVGPMETLDDPELQAWFVRTRGAAGIRIVGLRRPAVN